MLHCHKKKPSLGLKTNILLKRTVIISLIAFSIIVSAGIAIIFKTSTKRDSEHIRFVTLSGDVEKEILEARIHIDDIILNKSNSVVPGFEESLDSVKSGLEELHHLFTLKSEKNKDLDIVSFRQYYSGITYNLAQIEHRLDQSAFLSRSDTVLFNAFNQVILNYTRLQTLFPKFLNLDTIRYKREIITVLVINFIIILLAGFSIIKLIDQLIRADRKLVIKTIEVEKRERERIAADLHDGLGSMLSGLIIHIQVLEKENRDNEALLQQLHHLNYMSNQALKSIEEVINNLNPSALTRYGLIRSLQKYTEKVNLLGKTTFSVHAENFSYKLSDSTELLLYRICSELINNALKHSNAETAAFRFYNQKKNIHLEYRDNGVGFDMDTTSYETERSGLSNLIRRVESLEGSYEILTDPGKGVQINIAFKAS